MSINNSMIKFLLALMIALSSSQAQAVSFPMSSPTLIQWANAEVWVKDGYFYAIVEVDKLTGGTEKWCKFIPMSFINSLPSLRQKLSAISVPDGTQANIDECNGINKWKVAPNPLSTSVPQTRPLNNAAFVQIGRVEVGALCELITVKASTNGAEFRYTTNKAGLRGIALCVR